MIRTILTLLFQGVIPMFIGFGANPQYSNMVNAGNAAGAAAQGFGSSAGSEGSTLNPFFAREMNTQHSLTPGQQNEMLTASQAGAGGAIGSAQGELERNAARTGNATGVGKTLDEMARDRAKAGAGASEGIAAQDVMGAKQLNQEGAKGMEGLYGTNVGAQLGAMKQQGSDISQAAQMNQGWLKPLTGLLGAFGQDASGAGSIMSAMNN